MSPQPPSPAAAVATVSPRPPGCLAALAGDPRLFTGLLLAAFLALAGIAAFHHEFWRDEMQAWLIGRDLPTPGAVIAQARYEGAPPLWNLLLWSLARLSPRPELMQVATWLLAGATVLVICLRAPFGRLQKTLLVGNYYLLFQYGTVCRNYLPGVLALCLACVFALSARPRPWLAALCLIVAGWASVHSLLVAGALAAAFWGTPLLARLWPAWLAEKTGLEREPGLRPALPLAVTLAGLLGAIGCTLPAPDTYYPSASDWHLHWMPVHFARLCAALVASAFPLPRPPGYFWIPPWDTPYPSYDDRLAMLAAGLLWFGSILLFLRSPRALIAYLAGTLGLGLFLYGKYLGSYRHVGLLYFTFFFACWILLAKAPPAAEAGSPRFRFARLLLTAMLLVQAFTGLWAVREDCRHAFSGSKHTVAWLREHGYEDAFIAVGWDWAGAPLAGYLNRTLYYPHDRRHGSFTRWIRSRDDNLTDLEFYRRAMKAAGKRPALLILDHQLPEDFCAEHRITLLTYIAGSLAPFEEYAIHLAQPVAATDPVLDKP